MEPEWPVNCFPNDSLHTQQNSSWQGLHLTYWHPAFLWNSDDGNLISSINDLIGAQDIMTFRVIPFFDPETSELKVLTAHRTSINAVKLELWVINETLAEKLCGVDWKSQAAPMLDVTKNGKYIEVTDITFGKPASLHLLSGDDCQESFNFQFPFESGDRYILDAQGDKLIRTVQTWSLAVSRIPSLSPVLTAQTASKLIPLEFSPDGQSIIGLENNTRIKRWLLPNEVLKPTSLKAASYIQLVKSFMGRTDVEHNHTKWIEFLKNQLGNKVADATVFDDDIFQTLQPITQIYLQHLIAGRPLTVKN